MNTIPHNKNLLAQTYSATQDVPAVHASLSDIVGWCAHRDGGKVSEADAANICLFAMFAFADSFKTAQLHAFGAKTGAAWQLVPLDEPTGEHTHVLVRHGSADIFLSASEVNAYTRHPISEHASRAFNKLLQKQSSDALLSGASQTLRNLRQLSGAKVHLAPARIAELMGVTREKLFAMLMEASEVHALTSASRGLCSWNQANAAVGAVEKLLLESLYSPHASAPTPSVLNMSMPRNSSKF